MFKEYSKKQKQEWLKKNQEDTKQLLEQIEQHSKNVTINGDEMIEYLKFANKFYKYSHFNQVLINMQNPFAEFCISFTEAKKQGYSIKKGEKAMQILVPTVYTLVSIVNEDGQWVETKKLIDCTEEEKEAVKEGKYKTEKKITFKIGKTFDISQTTIPKEDYPKCLGFTSMKDFDYTKQKEILLAFAKEMKIDVQIMNTGTMVRGLYSPSKNAIAISELLPDEMFVSTLAHEIGHALLKDYQKDIPNAYAELQADAMDILVSELLGVEITQKRKEHLVSTLNDIKKLPEDKKLQNKEVLGVVLNTFKMYKDNLMQTEKDLDHKIIFSSEKEALLDMLPAGEINFNDGMNKYANVEDLRVSYLNSELQMMNSITFEDKELKENYQYEDLKEIDDPSMYNATAQNLANKIKDKYQRIGISYEHADENVKKIYTKDEIEQLSRIDILEIAKKVGTLQRQGKVYSLKEMDSLKIYPNTNSFYRFSNGKSGNVINFTMEVFNLNFKEALDYLSFLDKTEIIKKEHLVKEDEHDKVMEIPETSKSFSRMFGYLIGTRKISASVVKDCVKRKIIKEEKNHHNIMFIGYDENNREAYIGLNGTDSKHRFKGEVVNSDKSYSFNINNNTKKLIVTEAPIDLLSVKTILENQYQSDNYDYVSLAGFSTLGLNKYLENHKNIDTVYLMLDNDEKGELTTKKIIEENTFDQVNFIDMSNLYKDYKDPNEFLVNNELETVLWNIEDEKQILFDKDNDFMDSDVTFTDDNEFSI